MRRLPHVRRLVLTCLSIGPNHGYGIISWLGSISPDDPRPSLGSLYGALDALENDGLIELAEEAIEEGRTRRVMRITSSGRGMLNAELSRLSRELAALPNERRQFGGAEA